jgi:hypothetical protein
MVVLIFTIIANRQANFKKQYFRGKNTLFFSGIYLYLSCIFPSSLRLNAPWTVLLNINMCDRLT